MTCAVHDAVQSDPVYGHFLAVAGQDGEIRADELQRCLTQSCFSESYKPFSLETCKLMINMLDRDMSGTMGFQEFKELWKVLSIWKSTFVSFDRDCSGAIEGHEMLKAINTMDTLCVGYSLSPQALKCIMQRYSVNGRIPFDEFVSCSIRVRSLTDQFRRRDKTNSGNTSFEYSEFIQVAMSM